jgi:hypothetical protein
MEAVIKRWLMRPRVRPCIVGTVFVAGFVLLLATLIYTDDIIKIVWNIHPAFGITLITTLGSILIYTVGRSYLHIQHDLTHIDLVKASRAFNEEQKNTT